jgi:hypothetical protein
LGFVAKFKSPWEFLGSTGYLFSLLEVLFRFSISVLSEPDIEMNVDGGGGADHFFIKTAMKTIQLMKISKNSSRPVARRTE